MRKFALFMILFCVVTLLFCGCSIGTNSDNSEIEREEQYFRKINEIIKDMEFHTAKVKDGKIVLYDKNYDPVSEVSFKDYDKSIKFIGARKDGPIVYFIQYGAVDDEWGIMFVNDDSDDMMNGIWHADKIGSNSYEYSTMK